MAIGVTAIIGPWQLGRIWAASHPYLVSWPDILKHARGLLGQAGAQAGQSGQSGGAGGSGGGSPATGLPPPAPRHA